MKNVIIVLLLIAVIAEGYFLMMKKLPTAVAGAQTQSSPRPTGRPPKPVAKGDKLAGSAMEQFAFPVFPSVTDDAKKVTTGFDIKTKKLADGSTEVDFMPKDSDDQFQSYVVKPGNSLYFIEMTPVDDKSDSDRDLNYRDDYGIIVDKDGIVQ